MSFQRSILTDLQKWKISKFRKPLVLRGARQVGKTTVIKEFGKFFDTFLYVNLELSSDRKIFESGLSPESVLQRIYLEKKAKPNGQTLLFIDEIQSSPSAVGMMRYFFEQFPDLYVISAGSLLEIMMDNHKISFPVGRVEYRYLFPLSFVEFLRATGDDDAITILETIPFPDWATERLFELFHRYMLIGGMPEAVARYVITRDVSLLAPVYQGLLTAYKDDVSKYAKNSSEITVIRHIIETAAFETGKRITFEKFGSSSYKSREAGNALRTLERAMLLYLINPVTGTAPPLIPDLGRRPRLQFVDTGLLNFGAGLQLEYFSLHDLNALYNGILAEHIVAQEFMTLDSAVLKKPVFWVRELNQSNAEVDFLFLHEGRVIPVEVKSGKTGTLRSLHSFIDISGCTFAVRLYSGKLEYIKTKTPNGTPYGLLNLPLFLASKIGMYAGYANDTLDPAVPY